MRQEPVPDPGPSEFVSVHSDARLDVKTEVVTPDGSEWDEVDADHHDSFPVRLFHPAASLGGDAPLLRIQVFN